jgi:uncharacterized membrane protein
MQTINQSIEVEAPVRTVYNQWTQFEEFPEFMEGVERVQQADDRHLHWVAEIAGRRREWDAEIYEQVPDQRIAWRSVSGQPNEGVVTFEKISEDRTRVSIRMSFQTESAVEKLGDALGIAAARVKGDLKRFKQFVESHGTETGAWRGEIHGEEVTRDTTPRSKRLHAEEAGLYSGEAPTTSASGMSGLGPTPKT